MKNVVPLRKVDWDNLSSAEAELQIRQRAQTTGNVIFTDHARERQDERDIHRVAVMRILREGNVEHDSLTQLKNGDWECVVTRRTKGAREAGAATIIVRRNNKLIIKTVMWMD